MIGKDGYSEAHGGVLSHDENGFAWEKIEMSSLNASLVKETRERKSMDRREREEG